MTDRSCYTCLHLAVAEGSEPCESCVMPGYTKWQPKEGHVQRMSTVYIGADGKEVKPNTSTPAPSSDFEVHPVGTAKRLVEMEARKDAAYLERNQVVAALAKCFPSGVARTAIEGWSEDWHGCVYIDLPTGQASWHFHDSQAYLFADLPPYSGEWDGHDTPEKYRRVAALDPQRRIAQLEQEVAAQERRLADMAVEMQKFMDEAQQRR